MIIPVYITLTVPMLVFLFWNMFQFTYCSDNTWST